MINDTSFFKEREWLIDNLGPEYSPTTFSFHIIKEIEHFKKSNILYMINYYDSTEVLFKNKEDAMFFKLTWGGNV